MFRVRTRHAAAGLLVLAAALAAPAGGASPKVKVSVSAPASAAAGQSVPVKVAATSRQKKALKGMRLELLLSADARRDAKDVRLARPAALKTIRSRRTVRRTVTAALPAAVPAGTYSVLACVRPKKLRKRDRPACGSRRIAVTAPGGPQPGPAPSPSPTASPNPSPTASPTATPTPAPTPTPTPAPTPTPTPDPSPPAPGPTDAPAPHPATTAPPVEQTEGTSVGDASEFLYTGPDAIQKNVEPGTIKDRRVAVLRGRVTTRMGSGIAGVRVTVADHDEYGRTATQDDGRFDIAVNGGGPLTLVFEREGYIPAQRLVDVPWQDYTDVDPMVLVPYDGKETDVDTSGPEPYQVATGTPVTDGEGTRQATLLFEKGTDATMELPDGSTQPVTDLDVRMTEYTQGASGLAAMPGQLPPNTAFTYAAEFSIDQAVQNGATDVKFDKPVISYTDNFLDLPVGTPVPAGYYDREREQWVGSKNGIVIAIVGETGLVADVDIDGDGAADDAAELATIGMDEDERRRLAGLYDTGKQLWRVEIRHFTPWDYNYPYGPGPGASGPNGGGPDGGSGGPGSCGQGGSLILCDSQVLGETLPLTGSDISLAYRSDRVPGRVADRTIDIPLTGDTLPASADFLSVDLEIRVAGRTIEQSFPSPAANQTHRFVWDGLDAYGRTVQGAQNATVRVGYTYKAVYQAPGDFQSSWAQFSGASISGDRARQDFTIWQEHEVKLGNYDVSGFGLGNWTLDVHHSYDPGSRTLLLGGGDQRSIDASALTVLEDYAGQHWGASFGGDGGPAKDAYLNAPQALAHGADGSVYVADTGNERIRRVTPGGTIETYAGDGTYGFAGDGGPATSARISNPRGLAITEEGALYVADTGANRIRRITPAGTIDTIAGGGNPADGLGDDGPAGAARLSGPHAVAVAGDGTVYVADTWHHRVRRVGTDGNITTVAGDGNAGFAGDGGPAAGSRLRSPRGLAVDPDGNLLIADTGNGRVRRVGLDGRITTIAGGGAPADGIGDGEAATGARLRSPIGIAVTPDGAVLVVDNGNARLRRIEQNGTIRTVAGGGVSGPGTEGLPAAAAQLEDPTGLAVSPGGVAFVAEPDGHRVRKAGLLLKGYAEGDILIASEDGELVYQFSPGGRHERTRSALTGGVVHEFVYDSAGRLQKITDPDGDLLTVQRAADGTPTALVARGGQQTDLEIGGAGNLTKVTNPAGEAVGLGYAAGGLLTSLTEPSGDLHEFGYDAGGRLVRDEGPGGLVKTLERLDVADGSKVRLSTGAGRTWTYLYEQLGTGDSRRTVTDPAGAQTVTTRRTDGSVLLVHPEGNEVEIRTEPDPRFGMQAPLAVQEIERSPAPGTRTRTTERSRIVTMQDATTLESREDRITVNGRTTTRRYEDTAGPGGTLTSTSPEGREAITRIDEMGRVVETTMAAGTHPMLTTYDARGRVAKVEQGARGWTYGYDARDRAITRTDAQGHTVHFAYDDADRVTATTTDTGRTWSHGYDADGNRTSTETPLGPTYGFTWTPDDLADRLELPGTGAGAYDRSHSTDRLLSGRAEPGGATQSWGYDAAGRLTSIAAPGTATAFTYHGATERLATATWNRDGGGAEHTLSATFDGRLPLTSTSSGAAAGTFSYESDDDHQLAKWTIDAAGVQRSYAIERDADRLVTREGPFAIGRDGQTGTPTSYADATTDLSEAHDGHGALASRALSQGTTERYRIEIDRDASGQVSERRETVDGTLRTFTYQYDADDRLVQVSRDGSVVESYAYDANGNRTSGAAQYDLQDRITQLGATAYVFDADGFLDKRGGDDFDYGRRGELLRAQVAGRDVRYDYDAFGRLVRRQDGTDSTQFLYGNPDDAFQLTASIDDAGVLTTYFYDDEGALHGFERGAQRYRVGADQVGTPRVVIDASGAIVKSIERDSWGRVLSDSAPAFELPVGFAGGIEDPVTRLVRFGLRDYDPDAGRWTARDPAFFEGSPINLYAYVGNDPVSLRDPTGLICIGLSGYLGIGAGFQVCADKDGVGACAEAGVGLGGGVDADLLASPENSDSTFGEVTAKVGPAGVTVGAEFDDCGNWKVGGSVGAGPVGLGGSVGSQGPQGQVKVGAGLEIGAKVGVKSCRKFSF